MDFDVIIIGAGAAGMMCAVQAGQRGRRVLLIDHWPRIGERIRISGGGRCNFTNRDAGADRYLSRNPHFCRSALARFTPADFVAMVERRGIAYHERDRGQLFCTRSAQDVIDMLAGACDAAGVRWAYPCAVVSVERLPPTPADDGPRFAVGSDRGLFTCRSLVVATGGLAVPQLGASPFGYRLAEQFGLGVVAPKPALVPLALEPDALASLKPLAGVSIDASASCGGRPPHFHAGVLLTHRGLSGPAILQVSSYWQAREYDGRGRGPVQIDLLPGVDAVAWLSGHRRGTARLPNLLAERLPRRFAHEWCGLFGWAGRVSELSARDLETVAHALKGWSLMPAGTLGYAKAEVTLGGVHTRDLSSKTMEAVRVPGLYFVGEVVDVTGWLGGYNFQWAWASGWVAGQYA